MIPLKSFSQSTGELTTDSLVKMGFENVRWTDTPEERVYVVENSAYKIQALGIRKAVDIIQSMGLPKDKSCKLIVTNYNIPQVSLTYQPLAGDIIGMILVVIAKLVNDSVNHNVAFLLRLNEKLIDHIISFPQ